MSFWMIPSTFPSSFLLIWKEGLYNFRRSFLFFFSLFFILVLYYSIVDTKTLSKRIFWALYYFHTHFNMICNNFRLTDGDLKDNIKLKSIFRDDGAFIWHIFFILYWWGHWNVEPVAEFDEPSLGCLERICFAQLNCKFSYLFLVS